MNKHRRIRKRERKNGFIGRLFAKTETPAHLTEEQEWYLDTPDVRLTRVFTIVLVLHVVAVGGIVAFKMIEKASAPATALAQEATKAASAPEPSAAAPAPAKTLAAPAPAAKAASKPEVAAGKDREPVVMDHPSAEGYREYRVVIGDTVSSVARKMNADEDLVREINQLGPRDSLPSGKWLRLPKAEASPPKAPVAPVAIAQDAPKPAAKKTEPPKGDKQVARVDPPAETKAPEKSPVKEPAPAQPSNYKVQKGDTPYGIARRFGVDIKDLMAANGIDKPENLRAGQTVVIPKN